jgi:hypothetical protein
VAERTRRTARRSTGRPTAITSLTDSVMFHNWLIHSDAGIGKTVFAGTAPNLLFLTIEAEGTQSAAYAGSKASQWVLHNAKDFSEAQDYFVNGSGCQDFDWVSIDSASELEDKEVRQILEEGKKKNPRRSLDKMALEDYQIRDTRLMEIVDTFNRLPINVIYTAHTMDVESQDAEGNDVLTAMPMLGSQNNGKLSRKVCGKVTLVGHLDVVRTEKEGDKKAPTVRRLYTEAVPGIFAKNRVGLGEYVDNPTVPLLLQLAEEARQNAQMGTGTRARRSRRAR